MMLIKNIYNLWKQLYPLQGCKNNVMVTLNVIHTVVCPYFLCDFVAGPFLISNPCCFF